MEMLERKLEGMKEVKPLTQTEVKVLEFEKHYLAGDMDRAYDAAMDLDETYFQRGEDLLKATPYKTR
jgi:hypothetical protein